jgi:hypothetical protein
MGFLMGTGFSGGSNLGEFNKTEKHTYDIYYD